MSIEKNIADRKAAEHLLFAMIDIVRDEFQKLTSLTMAETLRSRYRKVLDL